MISFTSIFGQQNGQVLRGSIVDQISHQPIAFANVILSDSLVATTDDNGNFRFEGIQVGIYKLAVSYIGYEDILLRNINVDAGKEAIYNLTLLEAAHQLNEIVVTASKERTKPLNEMSLLSTRMVGVEETKKYASAFNDPARMANSFAGVVQTDSGNNNISIRGNSPNGLLWRLEGVEIPNPNHFSQVGTSGGGVSILSGQLLANSDFSTGAFAAEYGNALSGVFDIKLRKGNDEKREYTFQLGVLGIDLAAEGPFTRGSNNSYLVNYRYSTLGILSEVIDFGGFVTTFQDLSYNMSFKNKTWGDITLFGLNGLSSQVGRDSLDNYDLDFVANTLVKGITHSKTITKNSFLRSAIVFSKTTNKISVIEEDESSNEQYNSFQESHENKQVTLSTKLQYKLNARTSMKVGVNHNLYWYKEFKSNQDDIFSPTEIYYNQLGNTSSTQTYAQFLFRASDRLTSSAGVHYFYNWLNSTRSLEPRVSLKLATAVNQSLSLGYGLHSQTIPLGSIFAEFAEEGKTIRPNLNLEMSKAHHFILGYNYKANPYLNIKIEGYFQSLFDIPQGTVESENRSLLNKADGTLDIKLISNGKGRNYGAEFTAEKYLNNRFYFTYTGSLFKSEFKGNDGSWYNTRFNTGFINSLTGGKEFTISKRKKRTMSIDIKTIYTGGLRQNPIDLQQSIIENSTVYDRSEPFNTQLPSYFRFDLKVSFKRNYKHMTTSLVFDIQNITNRENAGFDDYDSTTQSIKRYNQLGLLPVIAYKIEF